jgi:hypothetical protein
LSPQKGKHREVKNLPLVGVDCSVLFLWRLLRQAWRLWLLVSLVPLAGELLVGKGGVGVGDVDTKY